MTMFWPDQKVALRIVDDPSGEGFDPAAYPDYRVIEVTCDQMKDPQEMGAVADELARLVRDTEEVDIG